MSEKDDAELDGLAIQARFTAEEAAALENYRRSQPVIPTRADAMRTLIQIGLATAARRAKT